MVEIDGTNGNGNHGGVVLDIIILHLAPSRKFLF